jgi:hypothetical protein
MASLGRCRAVGVVMTGDLFGHVAPVSKAAAKRARLDAQTEWEQRHLARWFELSGDTMERLIADIEAYQPGDHPADMMGLRGEVYQPVTAAWEAGQIANPGFMCAVHRAMQHLAIARPWRHGDWR